MPDQNQKLEGFKAHFNSSISQEIQDYVTDKLLLGSRYIFTRRFGSFQFGYCTHCKDEYMTEFLKHGQEAICKKCNSRCLVKASGRGRKYLTDKAYFVYYEKSLINPQAIVARGFFVKRDYTGVYYNVDTIFKSEAMYLFEPGESLMYLPQYWGNQKWYKNDSVRSEYSAYASWAEVDCHYDSIREAVKGTPFQYSTWEQYIERDCVKFFGLYSQYPCIEHLTKMRMDYFVKAKIFGGKTYNAINWRGKNAVQILKLSKQDLREIKDSTLKIKPLTIRLFQISRKDNNRPSLEEIQAFVNLIGDRDFEDLKKVLKHTNLKRAIAYIRKQFMREDEKKRYSDPDQVLITWKDYISDCIALEFDLTQERVLFPSNLFASHQNRTVQVKVQADAILNAKISKRLPSLAKYRYEYAGFFIRPATSSDELIAEGKAHGHCVGTYAESYAYGKTNILLIRKKAEPDVPFYTMEIKDNRIVQTQGLKHRLPEGEVKAFIEAFKTEKLEKPKKTKVKIEQRQEVAV